MNHLPYQKTDIDEIYIPEKTIKILCKRDDRFYGGYGGSKARMLKYILFPIKEKGTELILTAGGPCSNFNRALSVYCAEMNIRLRIISYTDHSEQYESSLNYHITRLMGAEYVYCDKNSVSAMVQKEKEKLEGERCQYEFIYGGAEGNIAGINAYYDAVAELKEQVEDIKYIFIPCGTGTTTSGICAGLQDFFPDAKVHAISIARDWRAERSVLEKNILQLNEQTGKKYTLDNLVFHDEFLSGGYSHSSEQIEWAISEVARVSGMILDPIYSGKAFWGMMKVLEDMGETIIRSNGDILFWNTGGMINYLSSLRYREIKRV